MTERSAKLNNKEEIINNKKGAVQRTALIISFRKAKHRFYSFFFIIYYLINTQNLTLSFLPLPFLLKSRQEQALALQHTELYLCVSKGGKVKYGAEQHRLNLCIAKTENRPLSYPGFTLAYFNPQKKKADFLLFRKSAFSTV